MQAAGQLKPTQTTEASVSRTGEGRWRLEIPAGPKGKYRLAQVDDYASLARRNYPWQPPFHLSLRARASSRSIPGTWGFGLWNNPFGMAILRGVELLRLPALPDTAWFFFASPENYLSLRDDLPASGALAAVFRSARNPAPLLALGAPGLVLAPFKAGMRLLRQIARRYVQESAAQLLLDPTEWHTYGIGWREEAVEFSVDGEQVHAAHISPNPPLGLVIWVDNQFAALTPEGKARFGTLENPEPAWIEVEILRMEGSKYYKDYGRGNA